MCLKQNKYSRFDSWDEVVTRKLRDSTLPIRRVLQPLLFDFRFVLPDDDAAARINELESVEDVITGASFRPRR